ncbi:hypothetical protein FQR65_LT08920 [Abscondita terminalis]|nr:hypothetical protein FQR65_LT08920 [Abscondita terminalis]
MFSTQLNIAINLEFFQVKQCLDYVITTVFRQNETLCFVKMNEELNLFVNPKNPYFVMDFTKSVPSIRKHFRSSFIIFLNSDSPRLFVSKLHHSYLFSPLNTFFEKLVIVTNQKRVDDIFLEFWKMGFVNLAVISYCAKKEYCKVRIITSDPQAYGNNCEKIFLDFDEQICGANSTIVFPKSTRKYTNCHLTYTGIPGPESMMLKRRIALDLSAIATEYLNASLAFTNHVRPINQFSVTQKVFGLEPDMLSSCIVSQNDIMWVVPNPRKIPSLEVLKIVFKKIVWISIFVAYVLTSFVWFIVQKYFTKHTVSFSSALLNYDILTLVHYENGITNLDELADSNYPIYIANTSFYTLRISEENSSQKVYNKIRKKIIVSENLYALLLKTSVNNYSSVYTQDVIDRIYLHWNGGFTKFIDNTLFGSLKTVFIARYGSIFC